MSIKPFQKFQIGDAVIDTKRGLMGIVTKVDPVFRWHTYDYTCEYETDNLETIRQVICEYP